VSESPTKERLAEALRAIGLNTLADEAARGLYDDYESPSAFPLITLVHRLGEAATPEANALAERVKDGEFDGTQEEADLWFERECREMFGGLR
jgi:hypothetical protein